MNLNYLYQPDTVCDNCTNLNNTVVISWSADDIETLRPGSTNEELLEMLDGVSRVLTHESIAYGWEVLTTALDTLYPKEN